MTLKQFLKILWPTTRKKEESNPEEVFEQYKVRLEAFKAQKPPPAASKILEFSKFLYEQEEQTSTRIEQRATNSLTSIAISSALLIGIAPIILEGKIKANSLFLIVMLLFFLAAIVYLVRASITALQVFDEFVWHKLGPDDPIESDNTSNEAYAKDLGARLIEYTIENIKVNNHRTSIANTSRSCFRNAVFLIGVFGLMLAAQTLFSPAVPTNKPDASPGPLPATSGASWYFSVSGDSRDCGDLIMPKIASSIRENRNEAPIEFYWHLGDFRRIFSIDCDMAKRIDPTFRCEDRPRSEQASVNYVSQAWDDFIEKQVTPFGETQVFLGIGNHELYEGLTRDKFRLKFEKWLRQEPIEAQRRTDSAEGISSSDGDTYYHFIKSGVDFIYLDNADKNAFEANQVMWLSRVLASDSRNDSIKTIIVGMHAALPYSKSSNHAMDATCQGICSGLQVYDLLYRAQNLDAPAEKQKHVYVLASHSHYFESNIFDTTEQRRRGQVLPGWIVGTAGAEQYRDNIKYGYLQVEVRVDGTIAPKFKEVTRDMLPLATGPGAESLTDFCFDQNKRTNITNDAFSGDCPCGAAR
jgi:hypothetical protein